MKNIDDINREFQDYQEDLQTRDLHLRLLVSFEDDLDPIFLMLQETYTTDQKNEP